MKEENNFVQIHTRARFFIFRVVVVVVVAMDDDESRLLRVDGRTDG